MVSGKQPGLLFLNFGGPTGDAELQPFLFELLSDVLPGPRVFKRTLAKRISTRRAAVMREPYRQIGWSPIVADSRAQVAAVRAAWGADAPPMAVGMMFTAPTVHDGLRELLSQGVDQIVAFGLFPHWSFATSGSAYDMVHHALADLGRPELIVHYARAFFEHPAYVQAVATTIRDAAATLPGDGPIDLLFSAHGVPLSYLRRGDPYADHVRASVRQVVDTLGWTEPWHLSWQSRLGPAKWLAPSTVTSVRALGAAKRERVLVVPVSFVGEHIETLHELDREVAELAHEAGIAHFGRARALGTEPAFIDALVDVGRQTVARFGSYACARCLVPQPTAHAYQGRCPQCRFVFPAHLGGGICGNG